MAAKMEAWERDTGARKRARRQADRQAMVDGVGRFTGELAASVDRGSRPEVPCHKDANRYAGTPLRFGTFRRIYDALQTLDGGLGLFEVVVGGSCARPFDFKAYPGRGKVERIRATAGLVELVRGHGLEERTADARHFPRLTPPKPLELRGPSEWQFGQKVRGPRLTVPRTEETARLADDIRELNAFISEKVEGAVLTGWTRIFAEGRAEDYGWDRGGRLYARPADVSYQALPKGQRLALRINGEPVVEVDIRSSHLAIVYALKRKCLAEAVWEEPEKGIWREGDAYGVGGLPRAVVKAWVTVTLGKGKHAERWPKPVVVKTAEDGVDLAAYRAKEVGKAVVERHPILRDLSGISWGQLQFLESEAVIAAMLRLKREHGVPALPVHDSLIVPRSGFGATVDVLKAELERVTGQRPLRFKAYDSSTGEVELPRWDGPSAPWDF